MPRKTPRPHIHTAGGESLPVYAVGFDETNPEVCVVLVSPRVWEFRVFAGTPKTLYELPTSAYRRTGIPNDSLLVFAGTGEPGTHEVALRVRSDNELYSAEVDEHNLVDRPRLGFDARRRPRHGIWTLYVPDDTVSPEEVRFNQEYVASFDTFDPESFPLD